MDGSSEGGREGSRGVAGRRAPSMSDVARLAGVSLGTVSNALNKPEIVSGQTRQRIQAAIDELGFVRNGAARSLAAGSTDAVGLVLVDLANSFFVDIARGAEDAVQQRSKFLLLANADVDLAKQDRYLAIFEEARVAGILLAPLDLPLDTAAAVRGRGCPVVLVNYAAEGFCGVTVDEEHGGYLAARHLVEQGRTDLLFVGGPLSLHAVEGRLRGATRAVEEAGGGVRLRHVPTRTLSAREGRRVAEELVAGRGGRMPDGVVAAADSLAVAIVQALTTVHRVKVPEEIAVTGYDDNHFAAEGPVPVTTVRQPGPEMGETAARLLLDEIDAGPGHRHRTLMLKPTLVPRQSTVPPGP